jgi:membrane-bound serine protease (ClpP class)
VILLVAIVLVVFVPIALPWSIVVIIVACILEIGEVTVLRRWAKRLDRKTARTTGTEAMVGERGEVVEPCHPIGMVHLRGELWRARCEGGADTGQTVEVESVDGLTLIVARDPAMSPRTVPAAR